MLRIRVRDWFVRGAGLLSSSGTQPDRTLRWSLSRDTDDVIERQLARLREAEPSPESVIDEEPSPEELESLARLERLVPSARPEPAVREEEPEEGLPVIELGDPSLQEIEAYRKDILEIARAQRRAAEHSAHRVVD